MNYLFNQKVEHRGFYSQKWRNNHSNSNNEPIIPYTVADMDFPAPPKVLQAFQRKISQGVLGYPSPPSKKARESVQKWLLKRHGWAVLTDEIIFGLETLPMIREFVNLLTEPGEEVIIQTPGFDHFRRILTQLDRKVAENELACDGRNYSMNFKQLEDITTDKTKLFILCNPHNPIGRSWTKEELIQLGAFVKKHNLLVISDEMHSDIVYKPHCHYSLAHIVPEIAEQVITLMAPAKTFNLAGVQSAFAIIQNPALREQAHNVLASAYLTDINTFGVIALEVAYAYGEEWLDHLLSYLSDNVQYVRHFLETELPLLRLMPVESTYLLWIDFSRLPLAPVDRTEWLQTKARIGLTHGASFGELGASFERMNIATPRDTLQQGLEQLKQAYDALLLETLSQK